MPLFKNVTGQKLPIYAWDTANNVPKTGDAANITCQYKLDAGSVTALTDTNPTEIDSTNMPGLYLFDLAQGETNGDLAIYFVKSSTTGIQIEPVIAFTSLPAPDVNVLTIESTLGLTNQMKADVNAEADTALSDYDPPTKAEMDSGLSNLEALGVIGM
jgi:hypothetical protein